MSSTINQAQWRVWANLLERELAGQPASVQQIDLEREGNEVVAWFYLPGDDCFAVSFRSPGPMEADEIRHRLMRDPMVTLH